MASSDQDTLKKIEEMMTRMTANIIGRFHYLKGAQEKKKKNHLKQYVLAMKPLGLTKEQIILCFPRTLSSVALQWYHSLENAKMNDWNKMAEAFAQQYSYNVQLDLSLRDLETTKQLSNESISDFLMRWRRKASKMPNHPNEKDQVRTVMKNVLPTYGRQLAPIPLKTFVDLYDVGIQVEDAIKSGLIEKSDAKPQKKFGEGNSSNSGNNGGKTSEVKVINVRRELTPLGITLSQALETLSTKGFIKLLDLGSYTSNTSAPNYNASEYCKYHQNHGHSIDKCTRLCHDIEDLIQSGKILKPPINLPNIKTNHLPNYNVVPPPT
nr:uncharacterized protein LOC111985517 [Quercus suber]